jgi:hypothetical protein
MSRNRVTPPDDVIIDLINQGMSDLDLSIRFNTARATFYAARKRLTQEGRIGADAPVRRYPSPDHTKTTRASELHIRNAVLNIIITLPRIPTVDGAYTGQAT